MMVSPQGHVTILEVNTIPGMTRTSLIPKAQEASGQSMQSLVTQLLFEAWDRYQRQKPPSTAGRERNEDQK